MPNPIAILFGDVRSVAPDDQSRFQAVQSLLRPADVDQLFRPATHLDNLVPLPERVANWLRQRLITGDLRYLPDPTPGDWWQTPKYTLDRHGGDCEDLALLALSLLRHEAVPAVLVTGTWAGNPHAWIEGRDARGWFLIEATAGDLHRHYRPRPYQAVAAFGDNFYRRLAA
jgi:transglutaminase-like putative cysteine protease